MSSVLGGQVFSTEFSSIIVDFRNLNLTCESEDHPDLLFLYLSYFLSVSGDHTQADLCHKAYELLMTINTRMKQCGWGGVI